MVPLQTLAAVLFFLFFFFFQHSLFSHLVIYLILDILDLETQQTVLPRLHLWILEQGGSDTFLDDSDTVLIASTRLCVFIWNILILSNLSPKSVPLPEFYISIRSFQSFLVIQAVYLWGTLKHMKILTLHMGSVFSSVCVCVCVCVWHVYDTFSPIFPEINSICIITRAFWMDSKESVSSHFVTFIIAQLSFYRNQIEAGFT